MLHEEVGFKRSTDIVVAMSVIGLLGGEKIRSMAHLQLDKNYQIDSVYTI